jgi:hypothetical protein
VQIQNYLKTLPKLDITPMEEPIDSYIHIDREPFIGVRKLGNQKQIYYIDPQGFDYARFVLRLK